MIKKNKKKYVLKIQKILESEKKYNLKYTHWKEIKGFEYIKKLPKKNQIFFPKLIDYSVIKCKFKLNMLNVWKKLKSKSKYCINILMEYKGKEIKQLIFNKKFSLIDKYCFIVQIYYINNILNNNKLCYTDYHYANIVYIKKSKQIKINNNIINTNYIYSIIDIAAINRVNNIYFHSNHCIIIFIKNIIFKLDIIRNNYYKKPDYKKIIVSCLKNKKIWNNIKNILYKYDNEWFDLIEKNKKITKINLQIIDLFLILIGVFDKKKYLEFYGFYKVTSKDHLNNLIPDKDIIFIISNINNQNIIIEYFINKINNENNNENNNELNNENNNELNNENNNELNN